MLHYYEVCLKLKVESLHVLHILAYSGLSVLMVKFILDLKETHSQQCKDCIICSKAYTFHCVRNISFVS